MDKEWGGESEGLGGRGGGVRERRSERRSYRQREK